MHLLNFCLEAGSVQDRLHVGHTGSHTIHHAQDQRSQGQTVAHSTVPQHRLSPIAIGYPPMKNTDLTWTWLENHHVGHELYLWIGMCVFLMYFPFPRTFSHSTRKIGWSKSVGRAEQGPLATSNTTRTTQDP